MTPEEYRTAQTYWSSKESNTTRMPKDELRRAIDAFLGSHSTCALACGSGDFVRCTPLEYAWRDGAFWIFSEGGLKFKALEKNKNVSIAVFEPYSGFGKLESAQVTGTADIIDPESDEFARAAQEKGIKAEALERVKGMLHLIKIAPSRIDFLSSDLKAQGYDSRQWLECK